MENNKHVKRNWHIEISDENFEIVNSNGKLVCTLLDHSDDLAFARDLIEFCHVKIPTEN